MNVSGRDRRADVRRCRGNVGDGRRIIRAGTGTTNGHGREVALAAGSSARARVRHHHHRARWSRSSAHPRGRGHDELSETVPVGAYRFIRAGAGTTENLHLYQSMRARFIRAGAGATRLPRSPTTVGPGHPRVRGQDRLACVVEGTDCGSSARARVRRYKPRLAIRLVRLIRACTEGDGACLVRVLLQAAHPRVRVGDWATLRT